MKYVGAFVLTFFMSFVLIPFLIKLAFKIDFLDKPTKRKTHKNPLPLLGGIGMFISIMFGAVVLFRPLTMKNVGVFIGALMIVSIGIVDDWYKTKGKEFGVAPRMIIQILAAIIVYKVGIVFVGFTDPFTHEYIVLPSFVQFILTITWIFGLTTVLNWSDGMDGAAGSLSVIAAITLFIVALVKNQPRFALMCILVMGSITGFLVYNRHPSKIIMGDAGSNFLGFILAVISLEGAFKQATVVSLIIPILALGVPIFDNVFVVLRRAKNGKPIYKADASQIHHRLLSTGLNQKQALFILCMLSVCLSLLSIIILLLSV